jgi:hypothetical protein
MSFLSSSSSSSVQNSEQMVSSSVTVTKVPCTVSLTQPAKDDTPILEVKLPAPSQMKQATSSAAAAPSKATLPVNDSVFYNAINEEVVHFGCELAALRSRVNEINVQVSNFIIYIPILTIHHITVLFPICSALLNYPS